ncbi:hypothetical protein FMUBM48_23690 [Nocardia cyriacigeorgica]|nr:hypothetical protein FMUBM48_23690 [Nocardia cyriacigeorgica]
MATVAGAEAIEAGTSAGRGVRRAGEATGPVATGGVAEKVAVDPAAG